MFAVSPVAESAEDNQQFLLVVTVGLFTAYEKALHAVPCCTQAARHASKDPVVNASSRADMSTRPTFGAAKHPRVVVVGWAVGEVVVTVLALVVVDVLDVVNDELDVVDTVLALVAVDGEVLVTVEVVVTVLALVVVDVLDVVNDELDVVDTGIPTVLVLAAVTAVLVAVVAAVVVAVVVVLHSAARLYTS